MNTRGMALLCMTACLGGCATTTAPTPTPLQIQAFQSKGYESGKSMVFGSVMSVFQDLGYIIDSADKDTGFITASSPSTDKTNLLDALGGVSTTAQTRATAFIEEIRPDFVTVRLNFVDTRHISGGGGGFGGTSVYASTGQHDKPILDPKTYQIAFDKIDAAIFVRTGMRAQSPTASAP